MTADERLEQIDERIDELMDDLENVETDYDHNDWGAVKADIYAEWAALDLERENILENR